MRKVANSLSRNVGIDVLKVVACFLVVSLHTINSTFGLLHRIIISTSVIAIPIFFTTSGVFMLGKESVSYSYIFRKIGKILAVCFMWECLYSIVLFIVKHEWRPFLGSFLYDFFQKGLFFHFWYLGAMIILYLLCPLLHKLIKRNPLLFIGLTICLGVINILLDVMQLIEGRQFVLNVVQTLRIWIWLFYFMSGGVIAILCKKKINISSIMRGGVCISYLVMLSWILLGRSYAYGNLIIEGYYSGLPIILFVIGCSTLFYKISNIDSTFVKLSQVAKYNMGIYILHPFVLSILGHFWERLTSDKLLNILFCIIVYIVSLLITRIIYRIPVINQLIKM